MHYGKPIEGVWANTKNGLGNLAVCTADQLAAVVRNRLKRIQYRPALIDGFLARPDSASSPNRRKFRPWPFRLCRRLGMEPGGQKTPTALRP